MMHRVIFCTAEYGKLNLHVSDSLAAKVQVIYKVPTIRYTCSIFQSIGVGKRHETPGSETKNLIIPKDLIIINYSGQNIDFFLCWFLKLQIPPDNMKRAR